MLIHPLENAGAVARRVKERTNNGVAMKKRSSNSIP